MDENDTENPDLNDDVLLAEYLSDDEKTAVSNADSDSDNDDEAEDDHVTKVNICIDISDCVLFCKLFTSIAVF